MFAARFIDRIGKGIRGAPRDALIADIAPAAIRGAAYGLRQALDSVGRLSGTAAGVLLMLRLANDFRAVFWVAVVPAFIAWPCSFLYVHEPPQPRRGPRDDPVGRIARLAAPYWWVVLLGAVFTLARFSEAFLVLRAQQGGLAMACRW